ncbi:hypothetical protein [Nocardia carnea]|uniref:hypothetical protein n=1 Tax=Nocardia carnea TaxID=37328 RepID=UPI002459062E|nr:hypothetical protein [Nocardia carnea]
MASPAVLHMIFPDGETTLAFTTSAPPVDIAILADALADMRTTGRELTLSSVHERLLAAYLHHLGEHRVIQIDLARAREMTAPGGSVHHSYRVTDDADKFTFTMYQRRRCPLSPPYPLEKVARCHSVMALLEHAEKLTREHRQHVRRARRQDGLAPDTYSPELPSVSLTGDHLRLRQQRIEHYKIATAVTPHR